MVQWFNHYYYYYYYYYYFSSSLVRWPPLTDSCSGSRLLRDFSNRWMQWQWFSNGWIQPWASAVGFSYGLQQWQWFSNRQ